MRSPMISQDSASPSKNRVLSNSEGAVGNGHKGDIIESDEITLDDLLEKIPIGKFHYRLLVICGMAFMADAMEVS